MCGLSRLCASGAFALLCCGLQSGLGSAQLTPSRCLLPPILQCTTVCPAVAFQSFSFPPDASIVWNSSSYVGQCVLSWSEFTDSLCVCVQKRMCGSLVRSFFLISFQRTCKNWRERVSAPHSPLLSHPGRRRTRPCLALACPPPMPQRSLLLLPPQPLSIQPHARPGMCWTASACRPFETRTASQTARRRCLVRVVVAEFNVVPITLICSPQLLCNGSRHCETRLLQVCD